MTVSGDTVWATVFARSAARDDPGAGLATPRTIVFAGILICAPLLIVGGIVAYLGKVSPVSSNTSSAARLLAVSSCEAAEKAVVAAGAIPAIDDCLSGAGQNPPPAAQASSGSAMHSITVKFDYDFARNPVCAAKMKKKEADACVATFVVYDISDPAKSYKLFSLPAPPDAKGMVKGITATSPRMLFGVGKHRIGVAAVSGKGRESPPVDCNVIVDIQPDAGAPGGGAPPAR